MLRKLSSQAKKQLCGPSWKRFQHFKQVKMATIILRQEGGFFDFQERRIIVEDRSVIVGTSTKTRKPDLGNATFCTLGMSTQHAVLWYENDVKKFYLQNKDFSNGCILNEEYVGLDVVELINGDRVEFGHLSGIQSVRAIVMLEQGSEGDTQRVASVSVRAIEEENQGYTERVDSEDVESQSLLCHKKKPFFCWTDQKRGRGHPKAILRHSMIPTVLTVLEQLKRH